MAAQDFDRQVAEYAVAGMDAVNHQVRSGLDRVQERLEQVLPEAGDPVRDAYRTARTRWTAAADEMSAYLEGARSALSSWSSEDECTAPSTPAPRHGNGAARRGGGANEAGAPLGGGAPPE